MPGKIAESPQAFLTTDDGVRISAAHDVPRSGRADLCFVVAHGFTRSRRSPSIRAVAAALAAYGGVVTFDLRGHADSGGLSTLGDLEVYDADAATAWARTLGYRKVVTLGWSMGGAVVLRHAALIGNVDAVIAAGAVSRWYYRGTEATRRVHRVLESRAGRAYLRHRCRTRVDPGHWDVRRPDTWPVSPVEAVPRIAPTPLLLVHGDRDSYFPVDEAQALYDAAAEPKELWVVPGLGHGPSSAPADLLAGIGEWATDAAAVEAS